MKQKWLLLVVGLLLVTYLKPVVGFAITDEASLEAFVKAEGFESVEAFEEYYEYYFLDELSNVRTVEELKEILGERINDENVEELLAFYGYGSKEELDEELMMYGDLEEDSTLEETFIYINALDIHLDYYNSPELTPITDENLQDLLEEYEITREELDAILAEMGESLENFQYIEDLGGVIFDYYYNEDTMDEFLDAIMVGFEEIGITEQELQKLLEHFVRVAEEDDTIFERLIALDERMMQLPDFESADDMTEAQMKELVSVFNEILTTVQIDAKYYLVKGDSKKAVTLNELMYMDTTNGADLLIELYNLQGEFLADMLFTADTFGSDIIKEEVNKITKPLIEAEQKKKPVKKPVKKVTKTENGGKLPNTAGNYTEGILLGAAIAGLGAGMLVYRKRKSA
ncbi:processed acidic surface protein [Pradoshia sp.]